MGNLIQKATEYATEAHKKQFRKYSGEPYVNHTIAVSEIVATVQKDEEVIAAAILHDTVEDTPVTHSDLVNEFGTRVANLVLEVTKVSYKEDLPKTSRRERNKLNHIHYGRASYEGQTIKLADSIHNCSDFIIQDPSYAIKYCGEKKHLFTKYATSGDPVLRAWAFNIFYLGMNIKT